MFINRHFRCALCSALVIARALTAAASEPRVSIGSRRELFVDDHLIAKMTAAHLELHRPQSAGIAFSFDQPWEGKYSAYVTVIQDGDTRLAYYRGNPGGEHDGNDQEATCVARSRDGIHWEKPHLGLFEVNGSSENNVVLAHQIPFSHNFAPFLDTRPGIAKAERFKAVAGLASSGLIGFASPDGIHWRRLSDEPIFRDEGWVFDSQNVVFWSQLEKCYVLYYRKVVDGVRSIARSQSSDFLHWSRGTLMDFSAFPPTRQEQLYTNQTFPWPDAPYLYVSLAARFMEGRSASPVKTIGSSKLAWLKADCSDTVLMTSRKGTRYDRMFPQAFVRPGIDPENWTSRGNYAARGALVTGPAEMSIYVQRHYGLSTSYLERLTLRTDGLASISAGYARGEVITKPITFEGSVLKVNVSTSSAGEVVVELQSAEGESIPGFATADCTTLIGDSISQSVHWRGGSVQKLAGKPVRIRFVLRDADVYSFRFTTDEH